MSTLDSSTRMVEQRILMDALEYLTEITIILVCVENAEILYNYLTRQYELKVKRIEGKGHLKSKTKHYLAQIVTFIEFFKNKQDIMEENFDFAFERALALLIAENRVGNEVLSISLEKKLYHFWLTPRGADYYSTEIKPIFHGILDKIGFLKSISFDKKGLERWLPGG